MAFLETPDVPSPVGSHRFSRLVKKLAEKAYRDSYVATHTRSFLARQMRAFRGAVSQSEFGVTLEKPQSVVSRLEDPNYGKWTLQTLFDVARKLDVAVIVRFVDFPTFLKWSDDMSDHAAAPSAYDAQLVDRVAAEAEKQQPNSAAAAFYNSGKQAAPKATVLSTFHPTNDNWRKWESVSKAPEAKPAAEQSADDMNLVPDISPAIWLNVPQHRLLA